MRLSVRELEVPHDIAEPVARETVCAKNRILIGDVQGRVILPDQGSLRRRLEFDLAKGVQTARRMAFEQVDPTLKSFLPGHTLRLNVGYATELIKMLVFHRSPPCQWPGEPDAAGTRKPAPTERQKCDGRESGRDAEGLVFRSLDDGIVAAHVEPEQVEALLHVRRQGRGHVDGLAGPGMGDDDAARQEVQLALDAAR